MVYDYRQEMKEDIENCIDGYVTDLSAYSDLDELVNDLYDALWVDDSVTGNGSGSYTFSRQKAEECLYGNREILVDAMHEFGCTDKESLIKALEDPEWGDVTIRCYLLGEVLWEVAEEMFIETPNGLKKKSSRSR